LPRIIIIYYFLTVETLTIIKGRQWWVNSDEPWQTLAACMEVANALRCPEGPEAYVCHLPIHQDGSCNGLQHYAALGRDTVGAESVNLTPADRPQDVYSNVANLVHNTFDCFFVFLWRINFFLFCFSNIG
jgi:DNA-directed RNA polymerase